ncbi:MAG TPA: hemerythrin domain-containing protein [Steroidobacteraceae bacterium]|jgi:hemerythrin superfamily protein
MAKARRTARKSSRTKSRTSRGGGANRAASRRQSSSDAIALLKADHRQVEKWFDQFESTNSGSRKQSLAGQICKALEVHTQIEHEIFYPAFLEATDDEDIHHEAEVEHDAAKKLIQEIEASGPDDDYYDAKVKVLSEMIKHHVNEEEQRDGMFAKARQARMDLDSLGEQLAARKAELMGEEGSDAQSSAQRGRSATLRQERGAPRMARQYRAH